jgi:Mn2+/Fe2+ NRAMP family transporter
MPYARYARYLKWLALVLLAYVASALLAHLHWGTVLHHAVYPSIHFSKSQLLLICAILGTTISPYLFFWQTSQEVEDRILDGRTSIASRKETNVKEIKNMLAVRYRYHRYRHAGYPGTGRLEQLRRRREL